ncbi:elongation of very long chain fatty acids protein AAEL008004 [Mycetomoellerius zeteki]|uniref:elongation of very long chain fatty acids protein AAEL008004 n=1 Tax=Mycetomoellerius zeteki TaxID=64791 RepID=UPI00084E396F|nr:PREDICTED: elongation of very long chain fatty acids protein AAEL008004-like [Trachymyrmex zeteki]XP_018316192.1 PREDICTED: elongation of very long chain fatty acids protein AAEL008004-like [Trachymyrmex zeteki]XP_018316194.1 PREDICTED: elongation of very long chain fatty acids protein AAEL008004-like [Trachymyrmex zeteki]
MGLGEIYHYLFEELSVERTREWPFISSPYPLMLITFGYMYFVLYAGPRFMKDRSPYELKTFILIYDVIQILANLWFVQQHLSYGWFSEFTIICTTSNSNSPNAIKLFNIIWWLIFLKLFDYVETCIFVLRKKQNQVSGLHVYHHVSNLVFLWYYLKYILDERATFLSLFNCSVHVIMYIYYFIAAWSPKLQQMVSSIKPLVTKLQMVQFIVMIALLLQFLNPNCETPRGIVPIFIGNLFVFLYLFYDFHKKSYTKLPKQKNN